MLRWQRIPGRGLRGMEKKRSVWDHRQRGGTFHGGSGQPGHILARGDHYAKNIQRTWWHCNLWWLVTAIPDRIEGDWQVRKQRVYNLFQEFSYRRKCRRGRSLRWICSLFQWWWEGAQLRDVSPDLIFLKPGRLPESPAESRSYKLHQSLWKNLGIGIFIFPRWSWLADPKTSIFGNHHSRWFLKSVIALEVYEPILLNRKNLPKPDFQDKCTLSKR